MAVPQRENAVEKHENMKKHCERKEVNEHMNSIIRKWSTLNGFPEVIYTGEGGGKIWPTSSMVEGQEKHPNFFPTVDQLPNGKFGSDGGR